MVLSTEELNKRRWTDISVVFQKSMNALSPVHRIGKQMEDVYRIHRPQESKENETVSLKKQLADAVKAENYELAAELRDKIRAMEA